MASSRRRHLIFFHRIPDVFIDGKDGVAAIGLKAQARTIQKPSCVKRNILGKGQRQGNGVCELVIEIPAKEHGILQCWVRQRTDDAAFIYNDWVDNATAISNESNRGLSIRPLGKKI